jgi:membrane protein YdbS with pleckstrin-like domain
MLEKVKQGLLKLTELIPAGSKNINIAVYYIFLIGFIALCGLYIAGWVSNWKKTGSADLAALLSFITVYVGPFVLTFINTLAKKTVDLDKDGISDDDEREVV